MSSTLTIARRELTEKRFVFLTAIAFALLSMIVPLIPVVRAGARREALVILSGLFAMNFTVGLAMTLGATIVGRELSEGRLSFYFSKPVPASSIWFGKLIAALLLIVASFVIAAAPALLAGPGAVTRIWTADPLRVARFTLLAAAACFLLAHVISTFVRSRSAWIAFDFVAATICGLAIWLLARNLLFGLAIELTKRAGVVLAIYAALVVVAAGAWQVAKGRTDRKRSHVELSRFLWMALGSGLLVAAAFVVWVVSVPVSQITPDSIQQSGKTSWAIIGGTAKHRHDYRASFLYNLADGHTVRIASLQPWWGSSFSGDGRIVSWLHPAFGTAELYTARLDSANPRPIDTGITFTGQYSLSDDGSRAAVIDRGGIVTVYDLPRRTSLGSVRVPQGKNFSLFFVSNDLVRIYAHQSISAIFEYDLAKKNLRQTGELPAEFFRLNSDHTRALVWHKPNSEIHDARTGALIASANGIYGTFLQDGRIVGFDKQRFILHVLTADGTLIRDVNLPGKALAPMIDFDGGLVVLPMRRADHGTTSAVVVDINRGSVVRIESGIQPMWGSQGPQLLCHNASQELVLWNPITGEKRVIVGRQ